MVVKRWIVILGWLSGIVYRYDSMFYAVSVVRRFGATMVTVVTISSLHCCYRRLGDMKESWSPSSSQAEGVTVESRRRATSPIMQRYSRLKAAHWHRLRHTSVASSSGTRRCRTPPPRRRTGDARRVDAARASATPDVAGRPARLPAGRQRAPRCAALGSRARILRAKQFVKHQFQRKIFF